MTTIPADAELWADFAKRYPGREGELAKDGAGGAFGGQPKILVVLKEPNNSPGADLRADFLNGGAKWAIWHRLSEWMAGILNHFPPYESIYGQTSVNNDALRRVAVINLKKLSGGAVTDEAELHRFAFRDRYLLRKQINDLNPTLILACGTFEPVLWLLDDRVPDGFSPAAHQLQLTDGTRLVRWRHPSRCPGRSSYEQLRDLLASPVE